MPKDDGAERPTRVVVISDLHLAGGNPGDLFHATAELSELIRGVGASADRAELVILGDALDYLQVDPYLGFTSDCAIAKTEAIVAANAPVFQALRDVVDTGHRIRWCIGNHDLELAFPGVRAVIERPLFGAAKADGRLEWRLDGGHLDYPIGSGAAVARLVHGNEPDAWNRVDYAALRALAEAGGDETFPYPPGSRLVAKVLNRLKAQGFLHVDLLKPEQTVALPLTLALWPSDVAGLLREAFPLLAKTTLAELKGRLLGPAVTFAAPGESAIDEGQLLLAALTADGDVEGLDEVLGTGPVPLAGVRFGVGSAVKSVLARWLRGAAERHSTSDDAFALDLPDDLHDTVTNTFEASGDVALVVAGHTHLARSVSYPQGHYFNTGTWANLMRLPRSLRGAELEETSSLLRSAFEDPERAPAALRPFRKLTYVEIDLHGDGARPFAARLCVHRPAPVLASVP
jgi:UDP-2,3-diacylglucosamine pyrophosphatase LpxH